VAEQVEVVPQGAEVVDRLGLRDDVQLAALVEQQPDVARRLQAAAEPALRLADALGHGAHLAPPAREEDHDAVGLAELVGAQHDALVVVEGHAGSLPRAFRDGPDGA
jgi:hypothetical protein